MFWLKKGHNMTLSTKTMGQFPHSWNRKGYSATMVSLSHIHAKVHGSHCALLQRLAVTVTAVRVTILSSNGSFEEEGEEEEEKEPFQVTKPRS